MNKICEKPKNKECIDFILSIELKNYRNAEKLYRKDIHTLKWAVKTGYLRVIKYLTSFDDSERCNNIAPTEMDLACEYGHLDIVKFLYKKILY